MDFTKYKITEYQNGVSLLPDYPSDEGYTAAELKAVFDSRSDSEIKEQHNGFIDALEPIISEVEAHIASKDNPHGCVTDEDISAAVAEHQESALAHQSLFESINDRISQFNSDAEIQALIDEHNAAPDAHTDTHYTIHEVDSMLGGKVDKVDGKGLSSNDFTDADVQDLFDTHSKANAAYQDISVHIAADANPHGVTAAQVGAYTKEEIDAMIGEIGTELDAAIAVADAYIDGAGVSADSTGTYVTLAAFTAHVNNTSNPHNVTSEQVGASVDLTGYATEEYVDSSIQEAVLDSWEAEI